MKTTKDKLSPALNYIVACWEALPGGSWNRINQCMYRTLKNAIVGQMRFDEGDFEYMRMELRAGYWWHDVDNPYSIACDSSDAHSNGNVGNLSAAKAIEHYLGREPFMWAEATKTAKRLFVGAWFTWNGERVKVTSIAQDHLIACSYVGDSRDYSWIDGYREKLETEKVGDNVVITYGPICKDQSSREKIKRRYTVTLEELKATRKDFDTRRKAHEKRLTEAATVMDLEAAWALVVADGRAKFRHFDIEILEGLVRKRQKEVKETRTAAELAKLKAAELQEWRNLGRRAVSGLNFVALRINGKIVQASNGQEASVEAVERVMPLVARKRGKTWTGSIQMDHFTIKRIDKKGIQVGCTLVPWEEFDYIWDRLGFKAKDIKEEKTA